MNVQVKLFAVASQVTGQEVVDVPLPDDAVVADLRDSISQHYPALAALMPHIMIAVNAEYAADDTRIRANDEIACIPPVSGG